MVVVRILFIIPHLALICPYKPPLDLYKRRRHPNGTHLKWNPDTNFQLFTVLEVNGTQMDPWVKVVVLEPNGTQMKPPYIKVVNGTQLVTSIWNPNGTPTYYEWMEQLLLSIWNPNGTQMEPLHILCVNGTQLLSSIWNQMEPL